MVKIITHNQVLFQNLSYCPKETNTKFNESNSNYTNKRKRLAHFDLKPMNDKTKT